MIHANTDYHSPKLSITNLFTKFPCLTNLRIDTVLLLPPNITIYSNRLHSLSLSNYSFLSCSQLLDYLPKVTSLSIICSVCRILDVDSCPKPFLSITRLRLTIDSLYIDNLSNISQHFPNVKEFYLIIKSTTSRSFDDSCQCEKFDDLSKGFSRLCYIEINLPIKQDSSSISNWITVSNSHQINSTQIIRLKTSDGHHLISKKWL